MNHPGLQSNYTIGYNAVYSPINIGVTTSSFSICDIFLTPRCLLVTFAFWLVVLTFTEPSTKSSPYAEETRETYGEDDTCSVS